MANRVTMSPTKGIAEFIDNLTRGCVVDAMRKNDRLEADGTLSSEYPGFLEPRGYFVQSPDGGTLYKGRLLLTIAYRDRTGRLLDRKKLYGSTDQRFRRKLDSLRFYLLAAKDDVAYREGQRRMREAYFFLRNPKLAEDAKRRSHYTCVACKVRGERSYGDLWKSCIEAHHCDPLSERPSSESGSLTDPKAVVALCANCHRIIHSERPAMELPELREVIRRARKRH